MLVAIHRQRGASLVELMIAMALGLTALAAMTSLVGSGIGMNARLLASSRLNEEVNAIGQLLTRDIKRAGYNADTIAMVTDPTASPSLFANSLVVSEFPGEAANSCLIFAYDRNSNGVIDTVGTNENFGFRLNDGAVEIRIGGATCEVGGWQNLSDTSVVNITDLTFTLNQTTANSVISTQVDIFLQGELTRNDNFSRQFSTNFLVRNYD